MPYRLVIEFENIQELKNKLRKLLQELEHLKPEQDSASVAKVRVICDETVRKLGQLLVKLGRDRGLELEVYEIDSATDETYRIDDVTYIPAKDDLDILKHTKNLDAILVTGDKRLAMTAKTYGLKVVYIPPSNVHSKEDYALRVIEEVIKQVKQQTV